MATEHIQGIFFKDFNTSFIPNILHEIYYERVYDPHLKGKKDLIIVDFGANIGLTSFFFKDYAKQVYAVEPSQRHIECINKLIEFNDIKNIKVCPYAISNENGTAKFYHNDNVTMYSLKDTVNKKDDFEEVKTITVDAFMELEGLDHIDFLKMDLEGAEDIVVASDGFKKVAHKVDRILGEYHDWNSVSQDMLKNMFTDLGFKFDWMKGTEAKLFVAKRV